MESVEIRKISDLSLDFSDKYFIMVYRWYTKRIQIRKQSKSIVLQEIRRMEWESRQTGE